MNPLVTLACALAPLVAGCSSASGGAGGSGTTAAGTTGAATTGTHTGTTATGATTGAGGASSTTTGTGGAATTTGTGTGGAGGAAGPLCPPMPPVEQSACTHVGVDCEYGNDPRPGCRFHARCANAAMGGAWLTVQPMCNPIPAGNCPMAPAAMGVCMPNGLVCLYPDGAQCGCSNCLAACGGNPVWTCTPPPAAGCPAGTGPNSGQPCDHEGLTCTYGTCSVGTIVNRVCTAGVWKDQPAVCPK